MHARPVSAKRSAARARGIALLTVILILAMLLVLTITYLRIMRLRVRSRGSDMDATAAVIGSVVDLAARQISAGMPVKNNPGRADYDYPWTDTSAALMPATLRYPAYQSLMTQGNPARDCAWLATSAIEAGQWPHLTNLTGSFLNVTTSDLTQVPVNPATGSRVPSDMLSGGLEQNMAATDPRLVDADGDGIPESLWFYPPINVTGNLRYVAAAYIEDLSGKVNLNVASPLSGTYKGRHPGEVDLAGLTRAFGAASATPSELGALAGYRSNGTLPYANTEGQRWIYWGDHGSHARLQGDPLPDTVPSSLTDNRRYPMSDEVQLRWHGGIRDQAVSGGTPYVGTVEKAGCGPSNFLRAGNTAAITEHRWSDVPGFANAEDFIRRNPRRWVTTMNGEAARQIGISQNYLSEEIRCNINMREDAKMGSTMFRDWIMRRWFRGPDGLDGTADDFPVPAGFKRFYATASTYPVDYSNWMSSAFMAARSKQNFFTEKGAYGMPAVPMVNEFYLQQLYGKWGTVSNAGGIRTIPCDREWGDTAWAVELYNPHGVPTKLKNLGLAFWVVNQFWWGVDSAAQSSGGTSRYAGGDGKANPYQFHGDLGGASPALTTDADGDYVLLPGESLVLYQNGTKGSVNLSSNALAASRLNLNANDANGNPMPVAAAVAAGAGRVHACAIPLYLNDRGSNVATPVRAILSAPWRWSEDSPPTTARGRIMYSSLTLPYMQHGYQEMTTGSTWDSAGNDTYVGFRQERVRSFGPALGFNIVQARPNLLTDLTVDYTTTGTAGMAPVSYSGATLAAARAQGDTEIAVSKATNYNGSNAGFVASGLSSLGSAAKMALPAGRIDLTLDKAYFSKNWNAKSEGQFDSVMDLARVPLLGIAANAGNLTSSYAGVLNEEQDVGHTTYELLENGTKPLSSLCLPIDLRTPADPGSYYDPNVPAAAATHRNVPWGWLLPCMYDAVNPAMYGGYDYLNAGGVRWFSSQEDPSKMDVPPQGNGNGVKDWSTEVDCGQGYLVPGRINLNTMPEALLKEVLPIPDPVLRADTARAIVARRVAGPKATNADGTPTGLRAPTDRGLSSVFEVLPDLAMLPSFPGKPTADVNGDGQVDAKDARRHDLIETFGGLSNVASCRSDFFAMHVLVQGYKMNDFSSGPAVSKRALVIFSRSALTAAGNGIKTWVYYY